MRQTISKSFLSAVLCVAALLAHPAVRAVGLGSVEVESRLNQPLRAEIPLLSLGQVDVDALNVRLAEPEDFERIGLERRAVLTRLEFTVDMSGQRPVVRISSDEAVRDPFLSFLVRMDWPQGRLLREYTILLDPPVLAPAAAPQPEPAPSRAVERERPEAAQPATERQPEPASRPTAGAAAPERRVMPPSETRPTPAAGEYGPVRSGETLWRIADDTRPGDISINQMMMALLRTNPDAFFKDNINALKRGAVLRVPGRNEIEQLSADQARQAVIRQNQLWQEYRRNLAREAPAVVEGSEEPARTPESRQEPQPESRLELVPPRQAEESVEEAAAGVAQPGADAGTTERETLRSELARTREELLTEQQESEQLGDRVSELEDQVERLQRLLEMKNEELTALQSRAEAPAQEPQPATDVAEPGADAGLEEATADVAEEPAAEVATTDEAEPEPEPVVEQTAPAPRRPGWLETLLSPVVIGILGLLLIAIGVALFLHRRRGGAEDTTLRREAIVGEPKLSRTPESEAEPEEKEKPDMAPPEAGPADYDAAALRAALEENPEDTDTRLKLLRHYAATGDEEAFVAQAETLYAQLADPSDPAWQETRRLGEEVAPDNPLFTSDEDIRESLVEEEPAEERPEPVGADESKAPPSPQEEADAGEREPRGDLPDLEFEPPPETDETAREGEAVSDEDGAELEQEADAGREYSLEDLDAGDESFRFDSDEEEATEPSRESWGADEEEKEEDQFQLGETVEPRDESGAEETVADFDVSEFGTEGEEDREAESDTESFEISEESAGEDVTEERPAAAETGDEDSVDTKLELAEAYMDMGDEEGARDLLEEVVKEGNDDQKAKAKELLDKLG